MYQKSADSPEPKKEEEFSDEDELDKYMAGVEVWFIHQTFTPMLQPTPSTVHTITIAITTALLLQLPLALIATFIVPLNPLVGNTGK